MEPAVKKIRMDGGRGTRSLEGFETGGLSIGRLDGEVIDLVEK